MKKNRLISTVSAAAMMSYFVLNVLPLTANAATSAADPATFSTVVVKADFSGLKSDITQFDFTNNTGYDVTVESLKLTLDDVTSGLNKYYIYQTDSNGINHNPQLTDSGYTIQDEFDQFGDTIAVTSTVTAKTYHGITEADALKFTITTPNSSVTASNTTVVSITRGEHIESDWEVENEATPISEGTQIKYCTACGEVIDRKTTPKLTASETFKEEDKKAPEPVTVNPAAAPEDNITTITINPAFNMSLKSGSTVSVDLTTTKVKAKDIYDEPAKVAKAEEALGMNINPNKHYNLLDLTLVADDSSSGAETDISGEYAGLVKVIIPIPRGHLSKDFVCFRLEPDGHGGYTKVLIPSVREGNNLVIYLEHFSLYAIVEDDPPAAPAAPAAPVNPAPAPAPSRSENISNNYSMASVIVSSAPVPVSLKAEAAINENKASISWNGINGAQKYVVYKYEGGQLTKVAETKNTSIQLKNDKTTTYVIKYVKNGRECSDKKAVKITVKAASTKPVAAASSDKNSVKLDWDPIDGAEKYAVFKVNANGKLSKVMETEKDAIRFTGLKSGKTYKYAVKAYVGGKWTKVTKSDIIKIKTK